MSTVNAFSINCNKKYAAALKFGNNDAEASETQDAPKGKITFRRTDLGVDASPYIQLKHIPQDTHKGVAEQFLKFNEIVLNNFEKLSANILHASNQVMKMIDSVAGQVGNLTQPKAQDSKAPEAKAEPQPAA